MQSRKGSSGEGTMVLSNKPVMPDFFHPLTVTSIPFSDVIWSGYTYLFALEHGVVNCC